MLWLPAGRGWYVGRRDSIGTVDYDLGRVGDGDAADRVTESARADTAAVGRGLRRRSVGTPTRRVRSPGQAVTLGQGGNRAAGHLIEMS
ncbi:hypothetical protein C1I95_02400 [Micromonospora craterilacus]|uniref:Uncharacterized protein n=1 Tax=Micromonospora craterilacus TaxID=1655439 RepID=A0A2W2FEL2_9ACTN|nr:hypothetical protein C1I95_02400 [Micromonospora craterilacus]